MYAQRRGGAGSPPLSTDDGGAATRSGAGDANRSTVVLVSHSPASLKRAGWAVEDGAGHGACAFNTS